MRKSNWITAVAVTAISIPTFAFGKGPLPARQDDAFYSANSPEASASQSTDRKAATRYDPTWPDGLAPGESGWAESDGVQVERDRSDRQAATRYDPTWPDGLAPGEEGWASPARVRVAGTQYDATLPDGNVPGSADALRAPRIVELRVTDKGFEPAEIELRKGEQVKLVITRTTDKTCARRLVVEGQGIDAALPLGRAVTLALVPRKSGPIRYACAAGMIGGALIVR